ncbi:ricin-type beta-trefoil lectin domain protein [Streptosporangium sp. G11]|uniref:ricin-type beta-trefoil lectin domain protein n=1 Tax=Streptosporangium sp. G11 TaxID=3436926 RepID=UPI003EB91862
MSTSERSGADRHSWQRLTGRAVLAAATVVLATTAVAGSAGTAVASSATGTTALRPTAAQTTVLDAPVGTIRITNANQSLTAGVVNSNNRGNVFTTIGGNQQTVQQWNHINGGKLVSRGRSQGTTRCLETSSGGSVFIAPCVAGKSSQRWSFKEAGKQFRIQNFQTKKCLKIGSITPQQTAPVSSVECKAEAAQTWFATQVDF